MTWEVPLPRVKGPCALSGFPIAATICSLNLTPNPASPQCCGCWPRLPGVHGPCRSLLRLGHLDTGTRSLRSGGCPAKIQAPPEAAPWAGRGPSSEAQVTVLWCGSVACSPLLTRTPGTSDQRQLVLPYLTLITSSETASPNTASLSVRASTQTRGVGTFCPHHLPCSPSSVFWALRGLECVCQLQQKFYWDF